MYEIIVTIMSHTHTHTIYQGTTIYQIEVLANSVLSPESHMAPCTPPDMIPECRVKRIARVCLSVPLKKI